MPALLTTEIPADPTGWLVSEKFDGIRAIWDGEDFLSRNGNVLRVPEWFKEGMPKVRLDGELWAGRGGFERVKGQVQRKRDKDFTGIRYMVFETCDMRQPIEERIRAVKALDLPAHAVAVRHEPCGGAEELSRQERAVVFSGGEGLVIRRPGSKYRPGRAGDVVKVKRLVEDLDRWQG